MISQNTTPKAAVIAPIVFKVENYPITANNRLITASNHLIITNNYPTTANNHLIIANRLHRKKTHLSIINQLINCNPTSQRKQSLTSVKRIKSIFLNTAAKKLFNRSQKRSHQFKKQFKQKKRKSPNMTLSRRKYIQGQYLPFIQQDPVLSITLTTPEGSQPQEAIVGAKSPFPMKNIQIAQYK